MFSSLRNPLAACAVLLAATPALAEAPVKSKLVFTVNKAVMDRCVADLDINLALTQAALSPHEKIARRDVIRTINTCETKYAKPKHEGLAFVAHEALAKDGCAESGTCTEADRKDVAQTSFKTGARFIEDYADVLLGELRAVCGERHEFDCVEIAVDAANVAVDDRDLDWLQLDEEGRVVAIDKSGAVASHRAAVLTGLPEAVSGAHLAIRAGASPEDIMAESGPFQDLEKPIEISELNGFVRFAFELSPDECRSLLRKKSQFGATEVTIENILVGDKQEDDRLCTGSGGARRAVLAYAAPEVAK